MLTCVLCFCMGLLFDFCTADVTASCTVLHCTLWNCTRSCRLAAILKGNIHLLDVASARTPKRTYKCVVERSRVYSVRVWWSGAGCTVCVCGGAEQGVHIIF